MKVAITAENRKTRVFYNIFLSESFRFMEFPGAGSFTGSLLKPKTINYFVCSVKENIHLHA